MGEPAQHLIDELEGVASDLQSSGWARAPGCVATLKRVMKDLAARSEGPHPESGELKQSELTDLGDAISAYKVRCAEMDAASPPPLEGAGETMDKEIAEALMDSHFLRGVSAGWNAAHGADPEVELAGLKRSREGHMAAFTARRAASPTADGIMAHMPSREWLSAKVSSDPETDCEAGSSSKGEALPVVTNDMVKAALEIHRKALAEGYPAGAAMDGAIRAALKASPSPPQISEEMVEAGAQAIVDERWAGSQPGFDRKPPGWKVEHMALARACLTAALSLPRPSPADKGEEALQWGWAFEYLHDNGEHDEPSWEPGASPLDPRRHKRPAFQYRNVQPLYARPSPGVSREEVARKAAAWFGLRNFEAMAKDRADLRVKIRSEDGFDINEATQDDCLEFADKMLALLSRGATSGSLRNILMFI